MAIIGESDDGCVKDCMGKKLDDEVEKDIEDCSNNVTEKCGVVNNNMSNNMEGEILEDHFDGDRGNYTIEDNADVNPSTNVSLEVNIPEVANDSSIVSPSTPPGNDLNIAKESCSTWLDYVGPLITDELDSEKRWSYRDPKGNIQGSFSLAQLHMWKDYFPSDLQIWSYYGNVKETILLHNALKRRTKNAGRKPALSFMRPFGCHVTILNTLDHLGKFDGKSDDGFFVGYSINRTGPNWMFDIDTLTMSMNYQPVFAGNQTNGSAEDEVAEDAGKKNEVLDPAKEDDKSGQGEATNTNNTNRLNTVSSSINTVSSSFTTIDPGRERVQRNEFESVFGQDKDANGNNIYRIFTPVNVAGSTCDNLGGSVPINAATLPNANLPIDPLMPDLEDTGIFNGAYDDEDVGAEADLNNLETTMNISEEHAMVNYTQEEGIDYDEVFALVTRIEAIRLQVEQKDDGIFISQDKYVADILKKFDFVTVKIASTLIETNKALLKDEKAEDVDV
ncbi:ribonuclease H-like domain-containing protein [Tanacetum coccineum]